MLRQKHNLPHMRRVVRDLAVDGLEYGVRFSPDGYCAHYIFGLKSVDRPQDDCPAFFPPLHDLGACGRRSQFKLRVSETIRLLAIAGEKVGKARAHIPREMLNQN